MDFRNLGHSGLKVPPLCLGTMTFGEADEKSFMHDVGCSEATAFAIMNRALERGINFFDTADVYGQEGLTERVLGNWFEKERKRDQIILATKFRFRMGEGPNGTGASRLRILRAAEASLKRLKTDRIDLYQIHMQDTETPEEETLRALDDLVRQGKVLYLGASNYAAYRLIDSLWISHTQRCERFVSQQVQYSLVERGIERELVPVSKRWNLGILPWSPLAGGFLSGKYRRDQPPPETARLGRWKDRFGRYDTDHHWNILETVRKIATQVDNTPAAVSIAWLLTRPMVSSVIFGARSIEQLEDNLKALEVKLSAEQLAQLNKASAIDWGYPYTFIERIQGAW